jgi:hypothetical protein
MSKQTSADLRDALGKRLLETIQTAEELQPAMVSSAVQFLKAFPPPEELDDLPTTKVISASLQKYVKAMPFNADTTAN